MTGRGLLKIGVCWKWVSVDNDVDPDRRWAGVSAADEAALEVALRLAESGAGQQMAGRHGAEPPSDELPAAEATPVDVVVVTSGPIGAESVLRDALAVGATSVTRIDASTELDSRVVATALAMQLQGCDLVLCGDYSLDRGTGSVPAFLAAELGAAQALGLVSIDTDVSTERRRAVRRLDGGRREVLDVPSPAVLSVEGSVARLRRATLAASLASRTAVVDVVPGPHGRLPEAEIHRYRPRARTLTPPSGDTLSRVRDILDVGGADDHAEVVVLDPPDAARRILDQLVEWGYIDSTPAAPVAPSRD